MDSARLDNRRGLRLDRRSGARVSTYEDIRCSSGLLAANSVLADVAQRLRDAPVIPSASDSAIPSGTPPSLIGLAEIRFTLLGYAGGSNLAGLAALPTTVSDPATVARSVREHLTRNGYNVGGIDMSLAISTAAAAVGVGERAQLALGRADHLLRAIADLTLG